MSEFNKLPRKFSTYIVLTFIFFSGTYSFAAIQHADVQVTFTKNVGFPVLDPGFPGHATVFEDTELQFSFTSTLSSGHLIIGITEVDHIPYWGTVPGNSPPWMPPRIGSKFIPLSAQGTIQTLSFSDLFAQGPYSLSMLDNDRAYYLSFTCQGVDSYSVTSILNNIPMHTTGGVAQSDGPFTFRLYYRDPYYCTSCVPPKPVISQAPIGNFALTSGRLGNYTPTSGQGSYDIHGAIENYAYSIRDTGPAQYRYDWWLLWLDASTNQYGIEQFWTSNGNPVVSFNAPEFNPNPNRIYAMYARSVDAYGVPSNYGVDINTQFLTSMGSHTMLLAVGQDMTEVADNCTAYGLSCSSLQCFYGELPVGTINAVARPFSPDNLFQPGDSYTPKKQKLFPIAAPNWFISDSREINNCYDFAVQNGESWRVSWQYENDYGFTKWHKGQTISVDDGGNPGFSPRINNFDWVGGVPDSLTPGTFGVIMDVNRDSQNYPFFSLWLVNETNNSAAPYRVLRSGAPSCTEASLFVANPVYNNFDIPSDIETQLMARPGDQIVLVAKVGWFPETASPCPALSNSFLGGFNQSSTGPALIEATGAIQITGQLSTFDDFNPVGPNTISNDGQVGFSFTELHQGAPTRLSWRWSRNNGQQIEYWNGGAWGSNPAYLEIGNPADLFSGRWDWNLLNQTILPNAAPFAAIIDAFLEPGHSVTINIDMQMEFGTESMILSKPFIVQRSALPDAVITDFQMWVEGAEQEELRGIQTQIPNLEYRVFTNQTSASSFNVGLYLKNRLGGYQQVFCDNFQNLTTKFTASSQVVGSGRVYVLTPTAAFYQDLDSNEPGEYQLRVGTSNCGVVTAHMVNMFLNPAQAFLVRFHYRDHLGSSSLSKTFATQYNNNVQQPALAMNYGTTGVMNLYPQEIDETFYEPFGEVLTSAANGDDPRYTDHERDDVTGWTYMKGRYSLPDFAGKFNRPDPKRDWDWQNPSSINLYQYVRNNPINSWDPFGFDEFTDDPLAKVWMAAMLIHAGSYQRPKVEIGAYAHGLNNFNFWPVNPLTQNQASIDRAPAENEFMVHTHPSGSQHSKRDKYEADLHKTASYTVSYLNIYKYDPKTGEVTKEATSGWVETANKSLVEKAVRVIDADQKVKTTARKIKEKQKKLGTTKNEKKKQKLIAEITALVERTQTEEDEIEKAKNEFWDEYQKALSEQKNPPKK